MKLIILRIEPREKGRNRPPEHKARLHRGRRNRPRTQGREFQDLRGRVRHHNGKVGKRKVHPAEHSGMPGHPYFGRVLPGWGIGQENEQEREGHSQKPQDRIRVPIV